MSSAPKTTLKRGGEKPQDCKMCSYSSTSGANLKLHVLVHNGERLFNCKQCNYKCTQTGDLKKTHANTYRREAFRL